jgi:hypothetical protein
MYIISFINLFVDVMCRFEEDDEEVVQKPSGRVKQVAVKAGGGRKKPPVPATPSPKKAPVKTAAGKGRGGGRK